MRHLLCMLALLSTPVLAAVDINTASLSQLEAAGFSRNDAQSIINARKTTVFRNSQDLLNIEGITQGDLNRARAGITINGKPVTTRSGTAPAIPGVRPAIPGSQHAPDRRHKEKDHKKRGHDRDHQDSGKHSQANQQIPYPGQGEYDHENGKKDHGKGQNKGHGNHN